MSIHKDKLGNDERPLLLPEQKVLQQIIENYEKKKLLDNVTDLYNIRKKHDFYKNNINKANLSKGGLLNDWNL
jgi:hypothetical protein